MEIDSDVFFQEVFLIDIFDSPMSHNDSCHCKALQNICSFKNTHSFCKNLKHVLILFSLISKSKKQETKQQKQETCEGAVDCNFLSTVLLTVQSCCNKKKDLI